MCDWQNLYQLLDDEERISFYSLYPFYYFMSSIWDIDSSKSNVMWTEVKVMNFWFCKRQLSSSFFLSQILRHETEREYLNTHFRYSSLPYYVYIVCPTRSLWHPILPCSVFVFSIRLSLLLRVWTCFWWLVLSSEVVLEWILCPSVLNCELNDKFFWELSLDPSLVHDCRVFLFVERKGLRLHTVQQLPFSVYCYVKCCVIEMTVHRIRFPPPLPSYNNFLFDSTRKRDVSGFYDDT